MLGLILIILLVLFLVGGLPQWGSYPGPNHFYGGGPYLGGGLGLVLVIVLILVLIGGL
jgi:sterol desaturase/sphingolipid hydroxylase (fatty acid hydroxylase superfamily)